MIIELNNISYIFNLNDTSLIKKNNFKYLHIQIDKKMYDLEIDYLTNLIEYSLFISNIDYEKNNLNELLNNLFEMINLHPNSKYNYGIIFNLIINSFSNSKSSFFKIIYKLKELLKNLDHKNTLFISLYFFINNFSNIKYNNNLSKLELNFSLLDFFYDFNLS